MKIVINRCYGGFGLSNKAVKRLAELKGREVCLFDLDHTTKQYIHISEDMDTFVSYAFDVANPNDFNETELWNNHHITDSPEDRTDKDLITVVEELGDAANGSCAELKVIEIPDSVEWEIQEYDGVEWVAEKHRTWR